MTRSGVPSEFATGSFTGFLAAELLFDSGALRLWNGYGDLTIGSDTYIGGGALIDVSAIEEMISLIEVSRAHEANQKMIQTFDQNIGKAIGTLGQTT